MSAPKSAASHVTRLTAEQSGLKGHQLLEHPLLNEGSAFTEADRRQLGLLGSAALSLVDCRRTTDARLRELPAQRERS